MPNSKASGHINNHPSKTMNDTATAMTPDSDSHPTCKALLRRCMASKIFSSEGISPSTLQSAAKQDQIRSERRTITSYGPLYSGDPSAPSAASMVIIGEMRRRSSGTSSIAHSIKSNMWRLLLVRATWCPEDNLLRTASCIKSVVTLIKRWLLSKCFEPKPIVPLFLTLQTTFHPTPTATAQ